MKQAWIQPLSQLSKFSTEMDRVVKMKMKWQHLVKLEGFVGQEMQITRQSSEQSGLISSEESMVTTKFMDLKEMMKSQEETVGIDFLVDLEMTLFAPGHHNSKVSFLLQIMKVTSLLEDQETIPSMAHTVKMSVSSFLEDQDTIP